MSSALNLASANATDEPRRQPPSRRLFSLPQIALLLWSIAMCSSAFSQTSTTILLTVSSNGNPVSNVTAGSPITLTATVAAGSTAVKQGQVSFCDASAAHCTDIHLLGTAQLTSAGKAQIDLRLGAGSYSYKAEFLGTPKGVVSYAGSVSTVATLSVTGQIPTATTIAQSGPTGNYTLTASAYGFTKSTSVGIPTGTISFLDTTTNNSVLGTAALAPYGSGPAWVNGTNPAVGNGPNSIVTGDFNGDGNLDLAVGINTVVGSNNGMNTVAILLGDGKGNFTAATSILITVSGVPVLVEDFNQDGIPDLLLSDTYNGSLTVLLGNGDGTFTEAKGSPITTNYGVSPVVAGDFNGDGIPDLVAAGGYYLITLLGNGDGTFTEVPIPSSTITGADQFQSIVIGDFNGDGIPDLATLYATDEGISILLGNGDGTFTQGSIVSISTVFGSTAVTLATGDFNGDGKLDLAAPIYGNGTIAIVLGNGDGTFQPASGSPVTAGPWVNRIAVGDFNGDGITDLFVGAQTNGTDIFIFLGNGDGTFATAPTASTNLPCCSNTILGDFNGDGVTDLVSSDFYNDTADVFLTALKLSSATTNGISVAGQSPQQVVASYSGDTSYTPSQSPSTALLAPAAAPAFSPLSGVLLLSQSIALTTTTPGAGIYYEASGALQTNGYVPYIGPIPVFNVGSLTVQAYATAYNYGQSAPSSATYMVSASNPAPVTNSMSPAFTRAGGPAFSLTISGVGFTSGSIAYWGTTALATQYVSGAQLSAQVTAAEIATAGITPITVQTPAPGGGVSNVLQFELDSGGAGTSPSFTTVTATVTAGSAASYPATFPSSVAGVTVSCLNLPSGASCSYSPGASALTITTSASTSSGTYPITAVFDETLPGAASALAFAPVFLLPLAFARARRRKAHIWALALTLVLLAFAVSGCGGGNGGGATSSTHQATSSGVLSLTVQ
ncbi:MAG: FG-GAP-like repeat-containing protein [Candidatus Sulfotelmatobacter sp.]